jgi:hypothetical protein
MPFRPGVLRRRQLDATHWLVLVKHGGADDRFMVGIVGSDGQITDDSIHVNEDVATADFEARASLGVEPI